MKLTAVMCTGVRQSTDCAGPDHSGHGGRRGSQLYGLPYGAGQVSTAGAVWEEAGLRGNTDYAGMPFNAAIPPFFRTAYSPFAFGFLQREGSSCNKP